MNRKRLAVKATALLLSVVMTVGLLPLEALADQLRQSGAGELLANLLGADESSQYYEVRFALPEEIAEEEAAQITLPDPVTLPAGTLLYAAPQPEWQDHTFNGWYYDAACREPADGADVLDHNVTLYPTFVDTQPFDDEFRINYMSDLEVEPEFAFELVAYGRTEDDLYDLVTVTDLSKVDEYATDEFVLERLDPDLETLIPDEDYREQAEEVIRRYQAEELDTSLTDALTAIEARDESEPLTEEELFRASQESASRSSEEEALARAPDPIVSALDRAVIAELVFFYAPEEAAETDAMTMAALLRRAEEAGFDTEAMKISELIGIMTEEELAAAGIEDPTQLEQSDEIVDLSAFVEPYTALLPAAHFRLRSAGAGWNRGDMHQVELKDTDAVRFLRDGELSGQYVIYYNITVHQEDFDNRRLSSSLVFLPASEVEGVTLDSGLFQVDLDMDGNTVIDTNDESGVLTYTGSEQLRPDVIVAVYDGVLKEDGLVDGSVGYFRISEDLGGGRFAYGSPDYTDVIFTPDIIPARDDGSFDDGELLLTSDQLDFTGEIYETMGLSADTVVEPGDFITVYSGSLTEDGAALVGYGCITSVEEADGGLLARYDAVSEETMLRSADMYMRKENVPIPLTDEELDELARAMESDVEDSGFVEDAADYISDMILSDEEAILPESKYSDALQEVIFQREDGSDISLAEVRELAGGGSRVEIKWPPKFSFSPSLGLQHFDNQTGIRLEGAIEMTITIKLNDDAQLEIKGVVLLEVEIALGATMKVELEWRKAWIFPYIYDISGHVGVTAGIYTGFGVTITIVTKGIEDEDMTLQKAVGEEDRLKPENLLGDNNSETKGSKAATRLKNFSTNITQIANNAKLGSDGLGISKVPGENAEKFGVTFNTPAPGANGRSNGAKAEGYQDTHNTVGGGFEDKYANFIQDSNAEYVPIVEQELFQADLLTDAAHVIVLNVKISFIIAFKINVMLGVSITYGNAKQAAADFTIFHPSAKSTVGDLETPNFQCDFFIFGMVGIRVGFEIELRVGLISAEAASIGITLNIGLYLEFYGYFYVAYKWESGKGSSSEKFGSMLVQVGLYLEIGFRAQVGGGKWKKDVELYSVRFPLLSLGDEYCALDFEIEEDDFESVDDGEEHPLNLNIVERTKDNADEKSTDTTVIGGASIKVPDELFDIQFLELATGEILSDNMDRSGAYDNGSGTFTAGPVNYHQLDEEYFHVTFTPKGKDFADATEADKAKGGFLYNPRDNTIYAKPAGPTADELWGEFTFTWYQGGPAKTQSLLNYGAGFGLNTREISRTVRVHWKGTPATGHADVYLTNDAGDQEIAKNVAEYGVERKDRGSSGTIYYGDEKFFAHTYAYYLAAMPQLYDKAQYYEKKDTIDFDGFDGVAYYLDTQKLAKAYPGYMLATAKEEYDERALDCYRERLADGNSNGLYEFARFMFYASRSVYNDESSRGWMLVTSSDPYLFFMMHAPTTKVELYFCKGEAETDWYVLNESVDTAHPLANVYEVSIPLGEKAMDHMPDAIRAEVTKDTHAYDYVWYCYTDTRGGFDNVRVKDTRQVIEYKYGYERPKNYPAVENTLICMPRLDEFITNEDLWTPVSADATVPVGNTVYFAVRIPKPFNATWVYDEGDVESQVRFGEELYAAKGDPERENYDFVGWEMEIVNEGSENLSEDFDDDSTQAFIPDSDPMRNSRAVTGHGSRGYGLKRNAVNRILFRLRAASASSGSNDEGSTMPAADVRMVPQFTGKWYKVTWIYHEAIDTQVQYGEPLLAFAPVVGDSGRPLEWYTDYMGYLGANPDYRVTDDYLMPGYVPPLYGREAPYTITYVDGDTGETLYEEECYSSDFNPSNHVGRFWPIDIPAKEGYNAQWTLDGEPLQYIYNSSFYGVAMPPRDITLISQWTPAEYYYRWFSFDGSSDQEQLGSTYSVAVGKTVADIWPENDPTAEESVVPWKLYRYDGLDRYSYGYVWNARHRWIEVTKDDPLPTHDAAYILYRWPELYTIRWTYKTFTRTTYVWQGQPLSAPTDVYAPGDVITGWHDADGNTYDIAVCDVTLYPDVSYHEHEWDDGAVMRNPTCIRPGNMMYTCSICDERRYEDIPVIDHDYKRDWSWGNYTQANCTEPGYVTMRCSMCGDTYQEVWSEPRGHWVNRTVKENEVAATCTTDGSYDTVGYCVYCGEEITRETTTIPALGHWAGNREYEYISDANCTESGRYDIVVHCRRCGEEVSREIIITGPWGHSYEADVTEATCTEGGYTTFTCWCGDSYVGDYTGALGHDYEAVVTQATCTDDGYTTYICSRCGDSYVDDIVPAAGVPHTPGEPVRTEPYPIWESFYGWTYCNGWHAGDITVRCEVCGAVLSTEPVKVAPTLLGGFAADEADGLTVPVDFFWAWGTDHAAEGAPLAGEDYAIDGIFRAAVTTGGMSSDDRWDIDAEITWSDPDTRASDIRPGDVLRVHITPLDEYADVCEETDVEITVTAHQHSYDESVAAPTCTEQGYTTHTCEQCGKSYTDTYVDALGHDWGEWTVTKDAAEDEDGSRTRACARCGETETEVIPALGHTHILEKTDASDATCTAAGNTAYWTCMGCGLYFGDAEGTMQIEVDSWIVPALGHDLVHHEGQPATCTEIGWNEYDTCSRCDYSTYEELPARSHAYAAVVTEPTCTEQGYTTHTCSLCGDSYVDDYVIALGHKTELRNAAEATCTEAGYTGDLVCTRCGETVAWGEEIDALGHAFGEWTVTTEPTCTETGEEKRTCSRCDETETRVVEALGHDLIHHEGQPATCTEVGWNAYDTCSRCDYTTYVELPALGHTPGEAVFENEVPATCTAEGSYDEVIYCAVCGTELSRETITTDALGHDYNAVVTEPTCTEIGYTTYTCTRCGDSYVVEGAAMLGHITELVNAKAATCTEAGYTGDLVCTRCGETVAWGEEIDALGHAFGEWTVTTEPTCTETGEEKRTCSRCDETETRVVEALGHDLVHHEGQPATCTEIGWNAYDTCSRCDYTTYVELPALGHTPGEEVFENEVPATCTAEGSYDEVIYCTVCDTELSRETITVDALGHDYVAVVTEPTCTESGYTTYTCSRCGDTYTAEKTAALGHAWSEWTVTKEATEYENGSRTRACSRCGETQTEVVPALGHTHNLVKTDAVEATCTAAGSTEYWTCTGCGLYFGDAEGTMQIEVDSWIVPALGHDLVHHEGQPATCTEIGWNAYDTCSRCDYTTYVELPALGHTPGEEVFENEVPATCTAEGSYDEVIYCTVCDTELSRETITVDALGHDYVAVVTEPTCTESGYTTYTCTRCGDSYVVEGAAMLGHITELVNAKAATCTEAGYTGDLVCTRCGETVAWGEEIDALDHAFGEWTVTTEPTCTETGEETQTCSRCDETKARAVEALGHDLIHHEAQAATCAEIGWNEYDTCSRCDYSTYEEIAALGHTPAEAVEENRVEPTCTAAGSYDEVVYCSVCGEELSRETRTIPALGHDYVAVVTEPTCTEQGYTTHTCSRCGDSYTDDYTDAFGHDWGEPEWTWIGYTAAAATFTCGNDASHKETSEAEIASIRTEPTTEADGSVVYTATVTFEGTEYTDSRTELLPKLGAPKLGGETLTDTGAAAVELATLRGLVNAEDEITALSDITPADLMLWAYIGESMEDEAREDIEATLTWGEDYSGVLLEEITTGSTFIVHIVPENTQAYAAADATLIVIHSEHEPADAVIENEVDVTCTTDGSYDEVVYCTVCGEELSREANTIPALGHDLVHHDAQAATCTESGWAEYDTCSRCDYTTYEELPALGHDYEAVVTEPTCTEQGYTTYTCSRCDYSTYEEIEALGHTFTTVTHYPYAYDASSSMIEGSAVYLYGGWVIDVCDRCGEEVEKETLKITPTLVSTEVSFSDIADGMDLSDPSLTLAGCQDNLNDVLQACVILPGNYNGTGASGSYWISSQMRWASAYSGSAYSLAAMSAAFEADPNKEYKVRVMIAPTYIYEDDYCIGSRLYGDLKDFTSAIIEITIVNHAHNWQLDYEATTWETCTEAGTYVYRCACGETKTETVPAPGHDWQLPWDASPYVLEENPAGAYEGEYYDYDTEDWVTARYDVVPNPDAEAYCRYCDETTTDLSVLDFEPLTADPMGYDFWIDDLIEAGCVTAHDIDLTELDAPVYIDGVYLQIPGTLTWAVGQQSTLRATNLAALAEELKDGVYSSDASRSFSIVFTPDDTTQFAPGEGTLRLANRFARAYHDAHAEEATYTVTETPVVIHSGYLSQPCTQTVCDICGKEYDAYGEIYLSAYDRIHEAVLPSGYSGDGTNVTVEVTLEELIGACGDVNVLDELIGTWDSRNEWYSITFSQSAWADILGIFYSEDGHWYNGISSYSPEDGFALISRGYTTVHFTGDNSDVDIYDMTLSDLMQDCDGSLTLTFVFTSNYAPVYITLVIQPNPPEPVEPEEGADTDGEPVEGSEEEPAAEPNDETPDKLEEEPPATEPEDEDSQAPGSGNPTDPEAEQPAAEPGESATEPGGQALSDESYEPAAEPPVPVTETYDETDEEG